MAIQNNPLPIQGRITQVAPSQAKVNKEAPKTDKVLDLSQPEGLESEIQTHTATNTDYIKLNETTVLSVKDLTPEELTTLVDNLKSRALDGDLKLRPGLAPSSLISIEDKTVTIAGQGQETIDTPESSPIEQAEAVINKSNKNTDDSAWSFANADSPSLTFQKASDKPAPWNNHVFMADDKAFIYQTTKDTRTTALPGEKKMDMTLEQAKTMGLPQELLEEVKATGQLRYMPKDNYQTMLKNDFNFNGAFDKFKTPEQFTEAMKFTYPDRVDALGEDNFNELANRVYSYASNAQDTDGGIDVQEMQGMLYALDPEIRLSSNSNTPMQAQTLFNLDDSQYQNLSETEKKNYVVSNKGGFVPLSITSDQYGTLKPEDKAKFTPLGDRFIPLGDNKHGRATILTTRHIMENINTTEVPSKPTSFQFEAGISSLFGANDRFIKDASGSMDGKWLPVQKGVDKVLQDQGVLGATESLMDRVDLDIQVNGSLTVLGKEITLDKADLNTTKIKPQIENLSLMLNDAYDSYKSPDKTDVQNRKDFSSFVGLPEKELFDESGNIQTSNSQLKKSFDVLLHQQGRLEKGEKLYQNPEALIGKDGSFKFSASNTYMPTQMTVKTNDLEKYTDDFSNVLADAYKATSSPDKTPKENQTHFAELLGVKADDIFNDDGDLKGDKLMNLLGDTRGSATDRSLGSTGEAAIKGIITTLLFDPDYSSGTRMNVLIDEPLQDMEYLKLAQSLAKSKGVDVRFISAPTNVQYMDKDATLDDLKNKPEDFFVFVDMSSMKVNVDSSDNHSLSFTSQSIDDSGAIVETPQKFNFDYYEGAVHGVDKDFSKKSEGFKGAYIPLQGYNDKGKPVNRIRAGTE